MLRRWGPALLAALFCQLLLLLALPNAGLEGRRGRRAVFADDSAALLSWSRTPSGVGQATSLAAIPLQGLAGLPPSAGTAPTPNGTRLDRALAQLELMVSVDMYRNATSRRAHYILPPVGPLERDRICALRPPGAGLRMGA